MWFSVFAMRLFYRFLSKFRQIRSLSTPSSRHPPTVPWLLEHRVEYLGNLPPRKGSTPTESLYLMYEYIVVGSTVGLRNEIEHFFNQPSWAVAAIPDPQDPDPQRYAILAVLPYYLVMAFNRLIERGLPRDCPAIITSDEMEAELRARPKVLEEEPAWTKQVPALEHQLIIPDEHGEVPVEYRSEPFMARNIIVTTPHVLFV